MRTIITAERLGEHTDSHTDADATAAIGDFYAANRGLLQGFARKLAGDLLDPHDLLAEALASAVGRAASGSDIANIGAYLFAAMRNRMKDELRSARSRTVPLEAEGVRTDADVFREVDVIHERALVRRALRTLPADQQRVLVHVAVAGARARELTAELDRPAPAIHALVYRAKAGLRRAIVREMLVWGNPPAACVRFADTLPDIFPLALADVVEVARFAHLARCARCRAAWARLDELARGFDDA